MPTLDISNIVEGIAYTRRADTALAGGGQELADNLEAMMSNLVAESGGDWVVFFSALEGVDHLNQPAHLAGIWFCGPLSELTDSSWYAAAEPFRAGWTFEGLQTLGQGNPIPILATLDGVPHKIRVPPREGKGPAVIGVAVDAGGVARLVAVEVGPGVAVLDIAAQATRPPSEEQTQPTTSHLIALLLHSVALALIDCGLSRAGVMRQLQEITDPDVLGALGTLPDHPSPMASALAPYLGNPADYLDDEDTQVVIKSCLMLLMAGGEPTERAVGVAKRFALSLGVDLPL